MVAQTLPIDLPADDTIPVLLGDSGYDRRTGQRLWRTDTTRFGTILGWDGHTVVLSDHTGLWAIDPRTGALSWDIPFLAVHTDTHALTGSGQLVANGEGHYIYVSPRTMIGLRPLER